MKRALPLLILSIAAAANAQFYGKKPDFVPGNGRLPVSAEMADVKIDQRLNEQVPAGASFRDESGAEVVLGDYMGERPILLNLIFYKCTGTCTQQLNGVVDVLNNIEKADFVAGQSFEVINVSIDWDEDSELASAKKDTYMEMLDRVGDRSSWHFLTGDEESVMAVADAVGFEFRRDPANGNITHPSGLIILTPQGVVSKYFLDTQYQAVPLMTAVNAAADREVGKRDKPSFIPACINVDPLTGQRSLNVMNSLKVGGALTIICLFGSIAVMTWRRRRSETIEGELDE